MFEFTWVWRVEGVLRNDGGYLAAFRDAFSVAVQEAAVVAATLVRRRNPWSLGSPRSYTFGIPLARKDRQGISMHCFISCFLNSFLEHSALSGSSRTAPAVLSEETRARFLCLSPSPPSASAVKKKGQFYLAL